MKANTTASKKAKGSRLERRVAQLIRQKGLDKGASRMPLSGAFWSLPGDVYTKLAVTFECKNTERHKIWQEWSQAVSQKRLATDPVLVISGNNRPILAVMDIDYYLNLLLEVKQNEKEIS